jgi:hypothetical protein
MKKLLITLGLATVATAALAQGTVNPGNTSASQNGFRTNAPAGNNLGVAAGVGFTAPVLNGFYYEVLTAPSTTTTVDSSLQGLLAGPWSDTLMRPTNTAFATGGRMGGPGGSSGVVANWPSTRQSFIVVGWSAIEGTSWAQVSAELAGATFSGGKWTGGTLVPGGFIGATTIEAGVSGLSTGAGVFSLFGSASGATGTPVTTQSDLFLVDTVPEPSSFALAGLGAAALMIFRRRK